MNDAPVNTVPGAQATTHGAALTINGLGVGDVDAGAGPLKVTLGVAHGTLDLSGVAGLTFASGDGAADTAMVFTGTLASINAALAGVRYTPATGFSGADTLTITTDDQGEAGLGGALSDTDAVAIAVAAPPTLAVSDTSIVEGAEAIFLVSLSTAATAPVSVNYMTADGTATVLNSDYTATFGTLTFPAGIAQLAVATPTTADRGIEPDETFTLNLSAPSGATIAKETGTATLRNDDFPNQLPVAVNDSYQVFFGRENSFSAADGVLKNDYDPDGGPLVVERYFSGWYGQVFMSRDGSFCYAPYGTGVTDGFDYVISDAGGSQATGHVDVFVII